MSKGQFVTGWFTPLEGSLPPMPELPGPPAGGIGGRPPNRPMPIPPEPPGVGGEPGHPIEPPTEGGEPEQPIYIPGTPEHPITLPPGTVWPPFDPSEGLEGTVCLLVWVPGTGKCKWIVVQLPELPDWKPPTIGKPIQPLPTPPEREPKR